MREIVLNSSQAVKELPVLLWLVIPTSEAIGRGLQRKWHKHPLEDDLANRSWEKGVVAILLCSLNRGESLKTRGGSPWGPSARQWDRWVHLPDNWITRPASLTFKYVISEEAKISLRPGQLTSLRCSLLCNRPPHKVFAQLSGAWQFTNSITLCQQNVGWDWHPCQREPQLWIFGQFLGSVFLLAITLWLVSHQLLFCFSSLEGCDLHWLQAMAHLPAGQERHKNS